MYLVTGHKRSPHEVNNIHKICAQVCKVDISKSLVVFAVWFVEKICVFLIMCHLAVRLLVRTF